MASNVAKQENATGGAVQQQEKPRNVMQEIRADLETMGPQFAMVLPPGTSVDKFKRIIFTAVQKNPKLAACTKKSLLSAAMEAATDGLMPDGKQGAIVPYGEDEEGRGRSDVARWMPMTMGIRMKVLASGKLADLNVQVVYEGDEFDFQLGDEPFIHHKPSLTGGRTRKVIAAYSIATFPDGTRSREVMNADMIEDIRRKSKSKRGPWADPVFYGEMARKTVTRLHSKQLPMLNDLEAVLARNDDIYDLAPTDDTPSRPRIAAPTSARAVLDHFARGVEDDTPQSDAGQAPEDDFTSPSTQPQTIDHDDSQDDGQDNRRRDDGRAAGPAPQQDPKPPVNEADYVAYAEAHIAKATGNPKDLQTWWDSQAQRRMRNACGVMRETYDALIEKVKDRCAAMEGA